MPETPDLKKAAFRKKDTGPFIWFLLLSLIINGVGAVGGWWLKFPKPEEEKIIPLELVDDDVEKLGSPDAPEEPPPPDPEPTPPPPEPEPTPPPLDKPPEFEVPEATPTPAPVSTPRPTPKPAKPAASLKPAPAPAAPAPGLVKGSPTGAPDGTGHGGHTGGQFLRRPSPSYPTQALQMHITGSVTVKITVSNGAITDVESVSGPPMLASAAVRHVKANWVPTPGTSGTYTLPLEFVMH